MTALMMDAVRAPETSVYSNETTRRYIPEGSNLHFLFFSADSAPYRKLIVNRTTVSEDLEL
jgi:hypothetical protein